MSRIVKCVHIQMSNALSDRISGPFKSSNSEFE